jgi:beta-galactosidase
MPGSSGCFQSSEAGGEFFFGQQTPAGPGKQAAIFSNCDRLEVYLDGKLRARLEPDRAGFGGLRYPPFFADLTVEGGARPELRIDGFVGGQRVVTRSFSADRSADQLWLRADDAQLMADGVDATRVTFGVEDKFGTLRAFAGGEVDLSVEGPGEIVGDRNFKMEDCGGAAAVWVRSVAEQTGVVRVTAKHGTLGVKTVEIRVG